jgi:hypothetical protein
MKIIGKLDLLDWVIVGMGLLSCCLGCAGLVIIYHTLV